MKKVIKENLVFIIVIIFIICLKLFTTINLGFDYTINNDDLSYVGSGINYCKYDVVSMHGTYPSAQIMPLMPIAIGNLACIFETRESLFIVLKLLYLSMSVITLFGIYKIVKLFTPNYIAALSLLFFVTPDFLWMDNLVLTETPYMLCLVFMLYNTIMLSKYKNGNNFYFYSLVAWYIVALLIRPTIGLFPLLIAIFLLINKYDIKVMFKQGIIAAVILVLVLTPWTIRNYMVWNKFIPLTYGMGNPLLLGSYQGSHTPDDSLINYDEVLPPLMEEDLKEYVYGNKVYPDQFRSYYSLEYDGVKAKYRIGKWKKEATKDYLYSMFVFKPRILVYNAFYWDEIFGISMSAIKVIRLIECILALLSFIYLVFINRKYVKEVIFITSILIYHVALYSYSFAFSRYGQTLYFVYAILIAIALSSIIKKVTKKDL